MASFLFFLNLFLVFSIFSCIILVTGKYNIDSVFNRCFMREIFTIVFSILITALVSCTVAALFSKRSFAKLAAFAVSANIIPIAGNVIVINAYDDILASVGYMLYFIGMDAAVVSLLLFTFKYCKVEKIKNIALPITLIFSAVDVIQLLLNPVFHHASILKEITVEGKPYFDLIPGLGQNFHRIVVYGILALIIAVFIIKCVKTPFIYIERYSIILITILITGIIESIFIFSDMLFNMSMISLGVYGIVLYFFAMHYKPMRLLNNMLAQIASESNQSVICFDAHNRCVWANDQALEFFEVKNRDYDKLSEIFNDVFQDIADREEPDFTEQIEIDKDGAAQYFFLERQTIHDKKGNVTSSFVNIRDNTAEQSEIKHKLYVATHDVLTGLYNKEYLLNATKECVKEKKETYYVGFMDIQNFKVVNDIFGTDFGDYTLKTVADFLRKYIPESGVYGRLGGDTFGFCVPEKDFDEKELSGHLQNFEIKNEKAEHQIVIHVGVYIATDETVEPAVMFDRAHLAMLSIKDDFNRRVSFYNDDVRSQVLWDQFVVAELPRALKEKQIIPYLQPIVDKDGNIVGAEALARWVHPQKGFLSPAAFIPVFERNGMIVDVDRLIWRTACKKIAEWEAKGKDLFISVNISPKDFYFMDVAEELVELTKEYNISPTHLRIEITETVMMSDVEKRINMLLYLKNLGFIIEMDDFGSGYSSLNLLKDMPVDVLKIDMAFLTKSKKDNKAQTIVHNIINLSDNLDISSLTEGVETKEQYEALHDMGCNLFQGYYFAKPMTMDDFEKLVFKEQE